MATDNRQKAPTIHDIALEAGVSKSSVSRALLGQGDVSDDTRDRIQRAANRLGYVANAMARGLVSARTKTLGVVVRDITRPFYAELQAGMQIQAERRGYQIVTASSAGELEMTDAFRALKSLIALQVDGLAIASAHLDSEEIVPLIQRVPIVVSGRRESGRGITSVFCDDTDGGRQVASHLAQLGHRRVAILLVNREYSLSQHTRGLAMIETIREAGGVATVWEVDADTAAGMTVAQRIDDSDVTAIMCPTDTSLMDVLEVLRLRGLSAPTHYSVTGYDGFGPLSAAFLGLTTFRQPVREIGRTSVDLLVDRIEETVTQDRLVALRGDLIVGRTAGPVRSTA